MGPNFEFRCTQSQLTPAEPFFVSVDPAAGLAGPADFADSFVDPLTLWFNLDVPNFSCFGKLTTISFFIFSIFLALSSKSLISV